MKTIVAVLLVMLFQTAKPPAMVYICMGSLSTTYHSNEKCKGFVKCESDTKTVTLDDAVKKYGRKPCQICYEKVLKKE